MFILNTEVTGSGSQSIRLDFIRSIPVLKIPIRECPIARSSLNIAIA